MREGPAGDSARGGRWSDVLVRLDGCWNESRNFWVGIPWRLCHGIAEATPVASVGYRKCGVPGMPLTRVWGLFGTAGGGEGKCGSEEGGGGRGGSRVCMYVCGRAEIQLWHCNPEGFPVDSELSRRFVVMWPDLVFSAPSPATRVERIIFE